MAQEDEEEEEHTDGDFRPGPQELLEKVGVNLTENLHENLNEIDRVGGAQTAMGAIQWPNAQRRVSPRQIVSAGSANGKGIRPPTALRKHRRGSQDRSGTSTTHRAEYRSSD